MRTAIKRFLRWAASFSLALPAASKDDARGGGGGPVPRAPQEELPLFAPLEASPPRTVPATVVTISGTVVRSGSRFALREREGTEYPLDSIGRAWSYEGEDVRVVGKLDGATHLLHIDDIKSLVA